MPNDMRVLVRARGSARQIAALADNKLLEYLEDKPDDDSIAGTVLLGRVERVLPAVGAAFIQIGQPLNGFLPLKEMSSFTRHGDAKPLVTGKDVIVQVKKSAREDKGAYLSQDIALPGLYTIWMPLNRHVGVSARITDDKQREELTFLGRDLTGGESGVIMRYAAQGVRRADIESEIAAHKAIWQGIVARAEFTRSPVTLYEQSSELTVLLRDNISRFSLSVYTAKEVCRDGEIPREGIPITLLPEEDMETMWNRSRVNEQLAAALRRKVSLPEGGTLVFDEREALQTIDVNTASFTGTGKGNDAALEQNLMACDEIARQIQLRNLSGVIIIDFIDMRSDGDRAQVLSRFERCVAKDRSRLIIHGFTTLGLLETTRKRTRESLAGLLTDPCGACRGAGRKPRPEP